MTTFNEFGINEQIIRAISDMGFEEATPIQTQTIPTALAGKDLIGQAQTGTGKTAAFGIPLIEKTDVKSSDIQSIILTPTRELAVQIAEEINKIGHFQGVRALPIYGGQDISRQLRALKQNPQIIVATPGRFMDHMRRKTIRLQGIKMVVLDEADEMLNMGFVEDIETILKEVPETRQTLLFSATMPKRIQTLAQKFLKEPEFISVKTKEMTVENVDQQYMEVQEKQKFDVLCRVLDIQAPELAIIFGRTKRRVDELSEALLKRGYIAEGIHGDLNQAKRDSVIRKFKEGTIEILVATDVAARGLDVTGVTHVYNFDIPQDPESYVHRIGRTGRAGKSGIAMMFVSPREIDHLKSIERMTKRKIVKLPVPTFAEAIEGQQRLTVDKLLETIAEKDFQGYKNSAEQLLEEVDSVTLVSAALKMLTKEPSLTPVKITGEAPLRAKKASFGGKRTDKGNYRGGSSSSSSSSKGRGDRDRNRGRNKEGGGGGERPARNNAERSFSKRNKNK
ncbi:DEAD/DEAH box helicase [Bacillaceae bacterium IKA-2]|nr:DEAD/DEAH box helicase [Bacillaceae bacterium IKA-2]